MWPLIRPFCITTPPPAAAPALRPAVYAGGPFDGVEFEAADCERERRAWAVVHRGFLGGYDLRPCLHPGAGPCHVYRRDGRTVAGRAAFGYVGVAEAVRIDCGGGKGE